MGAGVKIVLAESCTAGLVAQSLSRIPGASRWFCGSAVVYRNETKSAWLGISPQQLADPLIGPVSYETAAAMCAGVLRLTPEADLAASVTGHLGPQAPSEQDGVVFIGVQLRTDRSATVVRHQLPNEESLRRPAGITLRQYRQQLSGEAVLTALAAALNRLG